MNSLHMTHRQPGRHSSYTWNLHPALAGALAGLAGGAAMLVLAALLAMVLNQERWLQLKLIASLLLGTNATATSGFVVGPILLGLALHLAASALLGVLFALLMQRVAALPSTMSTPEVAGPLYGLLAWGIIYFAIGPLLIPAILTIATTSLLIQHLVYGAITGLLYSVLTLQSYGQPGSGPMS